MVRDSRLERRVPKAHDAREMEIWECPACGREFGKRQAHVCAPAMSVDAYYAGRPPGEREIFEVVREYLQSLGPVIVEPVSIGILFKTRRTIAELRPMAKWVSLGFGLERREVHPRITRTTGGAGPQTWHGVRLFVPDDVDDVVRSWLAEAYVGSLGRSLQ